MEVGVVKRFSTIETLTLLLRYREVMFEAIELMDRYDGNSIIEGDFFRIVAKYQKNLSGEQGRKAALVFNVSNLLQSSVINSRVTESHVPKLWFNTSVVDIFRLCKISLFRPLTGAGLNAAMAPIWSIQSQLKSDKLVLVPGEPDYEDWKDELNHAIASLLGKIKANIEKLQRVGEDFDGTLEGSDACFHPDFTMQKYQEASRLYNREIKPLTTFLDKDARYKQGNGIQIVLENLVGFFDSVGDAGYSQTMLSHQITLLDLFPPIKAVSMSVSFFLQKTKTSIMEHAAIDQAYSVLRQAYEETLGGDQRKKYISLSQLKCLGEFSPISTVKRLSSFNTVKNPAFLNNVFGELARRSMRQDNGEVCGLLKSSVSFEETRKLEHSFLINKWVSEFEWPLNEDCVGVAHGELSGFFDGYSIPDLVEITSQLHVSTRYNVVVTNQFKTIEDGNHKLRYRVRKLVEE